ncbi:MAG: class I SAM-dependent methyltransferase [Candidatus Brocadiia bacterium]
MDDGILVLQESNLSETHGGGRQKWSRQCFEEGYGNEDPYFDHLEHARRSGIPEFAEKYRYERVKGWILREFRSAPGNLFLDAGTGAGFLPYQIREKYPERSFRFVGTDISEQHLRSLAIRSRDENPRFALPMVADLENLPFPDATFDGVTCSEVIEHVYDKRRAMREMARVLKPGGVLLLTTPRRVMVDFWKLVCALPRRLYRGFHGKGWGAPPKPDVYDSPISSGRLLHLAQQSGLAIRELTTVVCLPHESYLQFIPTGLLRAWVGAATLAEQMGWGSLFGLHSRLRARKPGRGRQ